MRILLVRPPRIKKAITIGEFMFSEPIGLEAVYAVLKADHQIRIFDMMVEKKDIVDECTSWKPDVVGLTSLCVDVDNVLKIAREIKKHNPSLITVVGGTQTLLRPECFKDESIDYIFQFTTSDNLRSVFSHLQDNDSVPPTDGVLCRDSAYESTGVEGRNEYIVPDLDSTKRYRSHYNYFGYKPAAIMQTSLGCSKHCRFCLRWRIESPVEIPQDMEVVFDQIRRIEEPSIMIFDNDFLCDASRLDELCDRLEAAGISKNFMCYGSVHSIVKNREAVARFARNGLKAVLVGYESFRQDEMESYGKKSSTDDNLEAADILKEIEVDAWASLIMHPDWTVEDFKQFRRYIRKLRPEIASLTCLTPFPTLPLHEEYMHRLIIHPDDNEKWTFAGVSIRPSQMSLRRYYVQVLLTNMYVNLVNNQTSYLIRKFGFSALFRIAAGSLRLMYRYLALIAQAGSIENATAPHEPDRSGVTKRTDRDG